MLIWGRVGTWTLRVLAMRIGPSAANQDAQINADGGQQQSQETSTRSRVESMAVGYCLFCLFCNFSVSHCWPSEHPRARSGFTSGYRPKH